MVPGLPLGLPGRNAPYHIAIKNHIIPLYKHEDSFIEELP